MAKFTSRKILTPVFTVSFPSVYQATSYKEEPQKFSLTALWRPSELEGLEKKRYADMIALLNEAAKHGFGKDLKSLPANVRVPLRDGEEKGEVAGYGSGVKFMKLSTYRRPGIIDIEKHPIGPEHGNEDDFYAGCLARAFITAKPYDNAGKGITVQLGSIQKVADGERFDGGGGADAAAADFADVEVDAWLSTQSYDDDIPF